jgi:hypothetical protein
MPTEVQNGSAVLHGIRNDGSPITIEGYATFLLDSAKLGHKFKLEAIEDEVGFDASLVATNAHKEVDVTFVPKGASRAAAEAVAAVLTPLDKVTLDNFAVTVFNGDWIYVGDASVDLGHAAGKVSLKLRKYDDTDQNASLTTTVAS